jgi:hypothetical protein
MVAPRQYAVRRDDGTDPDGGLVETYPHTAEGAIDAINRAAKLSVTTPHPHEVYRPDGRLLARYVRGLRTDVPPLTLGV